MTELIYMVVEQPDQHYSVYSCGGGERKLISNDMRYGEALIEKEMLEENQNEDNN